MQLPRPGSARRRSRVRPRGPFAQHAGLWGLGPVRRPEVWATPGLLQAEYGLPVDYETSRFSVCRWIESDSEIELDKFVDSHGSAMAKDLDGAPVFMATTAFSLRYEEERYPAVRFTDVKDYQKRTA